jgi:Transglycosylase SLT domain
VPTTTDYQNQARAAANANGIDPDIFVAQIAAESGFDPNAKSKAGAIGIAQFMPSTAQGMGVNPNDVTSSLNGAAKLDAQNLQKYGGDYSKMLAAYNAGGGSVDNAVNRFGDAWFVNMPAETQAYVTKIISGQVAINAPGNPNLTGIVPGVQNAAQNLINGQIAAAFAPFFSALPGFGIKVALFMGALMLVIIGLWALTRNPASDTGSAVTSGLNNTATGIGAKVGSLRHKKPEVKS